MKTRILPILMMLLTVVGMGSARAQTVIYSWDQGVESGGVATSTKDNEHVGNTQNIKDGDEVVASYITLRLSGKADYSTDYVTITLDKALAGGETLSVTAFRNKNDKEKKSGFLAKFDKGGEVTTSTGLEYVNVDRSDASVGDSNRGTEPNTCEFKIPAEAAGSTVITLTRANGQTGTNLYITKLVIGEGGDEPIEPVVTIAKPTFEVNGVKYESGATVEGLKTGQQVIINVEDGMYIYTNWSSKTGGKKETYFITDRMKGQNSYGASTSSGGQRVLYAVAGDKDDATGNSSDLSYIVFPGVVASEPVFSPAAGEVEAGTVVTLTKGNKEDKVFYTTDGSDPTAESTAYTDEGIKIEESVTIKAIAFDKNGEYGSAIVSAAYTIPAPVVIPTPTFTPESGSTLAFGGEVTINYDEAYTLYYTTDGSDPKTSDTVQPGFNNPETIIAENEGTLTIKAFLSNKDGESEVVTATYTVEGKPIVVGAPTFDPAPGAVEKGTQVHIIFGENATSVSFSTDGSDPRLGDVYTSSKQIDALAPIIINEETTIKAICRANDGGKTYSSEIVTVTYTVKEVVEPEPLPENAVDLIDKFTNTWNPNDSQTHNDDKSITYNGAQWGGLAYWVGGEDWSQYEKLVFEFSEPTPMAVQGWIKNGEGDDPAYTWSDWKAGVTKLECPFEGKDVSKIMQVSLQLAEAGTVQISKIYLVKKSEEPAPEFKLTFDPESGAEVEVDDIITMSFDGDAFRCSYTTDGSDPRTSMTVMEAMPNEFIVVKGEGELVITAVLENRKTSEVSELFTAKYTIKAAEPVVADVTIETKANGYGTFCYDKDLDFSASDGKAYIARLDGNKVYLTEIEKVPAGTGILVKSNADEVTVPTMEGAIPINSKNDFIGVLEDTEVEYGTVSILSLVNGEEGFYKFLGTTIPANKAYFPVVASDAQAKLSLIFEDADGIGQIVNNAIVDGNAYNLNGQRVKSNYKGVVIVNGKKYFKK
ncbi:MAG: chitobiase/beta-hexosaminidase C-terminal domain-containing protein [Prevotella sp.]|nr:chitobiase/beta-hexosaminidase C-terminal domain-containing protein [Prevotella sp.]